MVFDRTRARAKWLADQYKRKGVENHFRRSPPPIAHGAKSVLLVEGMWDNPNHWLRLWMFLHAFLSDHEADVVGVLRSRHNWDNWTKRRSLESLGIRRFIYLDGDDTAVAGARQAADKLLAGVDDEAGMLGLRLPDGIPAYTFFDTVMKRQRHPQPPIRGNPVWRDVLGELLLYADIYRAFFDSNEVVAVVSSHAWKNEWATLCWAALIRHIPFYYMTAHYSSVRIRRMEAPEDYKRPNEHLAYQQYVGLDADSRANLTQRGKTYLEERFSGSSDFVILRYASRPDQRGLGRNAMLQRLDLDPSKPLVVVFAHSWFDFPHTQAMTNFAEPLDWIQFTLETIAPITSINWAFKPHPCDRWYGAIRLDELIQNLPSHIALLPDDSDSLAVQRAADAIVTIQGTVAIEGAVAGKPVLCADSGMYTDWGFTHFATSRQDYAEKLRGILDLAPPTPDQRERAMAYVATAVAPPPEPAHGLKLSCDTLFIEGKLYPRVLEILTTNREAVEREIHLIREWMRSGRLHSFNVWKTVRHFQSLRRPEIASL